MNVHDFDVKGTNDENISLKKYEGKVLLIVNTATQCGFTPQYDGLQDMYEELQDKGFEILDFPCNQFGNQAPGSNDEIAKFCDTNFGITFPRFSKVEVNGDSAIPIFKYLKDQKTFRGLDSEHPLTPVLEGMLEKEHPDYTSTSDIKWNFTKFLVDKKGNVVERFEPTTSLEIVQKAVEKCLSE